MAEDPIAELSQESRSLGSVPRNLVRRQWMFHLSLHRRSYPVVWKPPGAKCSQGVMLGAALNWLSFLIVGCSVGPIVCIVATILWPCNGKIKARLWVIAIQKNGNCRCRSSHGECGADLRPPVWCRYRWWSGFIMPRLDSGIAALGSVVSPS